MHLAHKTRVVGALLVALALMGTPAALALEDATAFGFNAMRAAGTRPLLVILIQDSGMPGLAHDAAYYDRLVFGPLGGGRPEDRSVLGYFAEVSNGNFIWTRAGVVGPLTMAFSSKDEAQMRQTAVKQAGEVGGVNYALFDRNQDGAISPDELGVLVIIQWPVAQTSSHTVSVGGRTVRVGVSGIGDRPSLMLICHELSHQLGTLDLYGRWGQDCLNMNLTLMSCTGGPAENVQSVHLDAWHKMQLGWARPQVRSLRAGGTESLVAQQVPSIRAPADKGPLLLYDPARGTNEFFLIEYRSRTAEGGRYDANVASTGLAIWQIRQDEAKRPVAVAHETVAGAQVLAVFNRGAPSWTQGGSTLYNASHGDIAFKWMDGTDTGVRVRVGTPSSNEELLAVAWRAPLLLQWYDWEFLGGYLTSNPAVGRNADGRLEVFVRGGNNALYSKWQLSKWQLRPGSREWSDWTYFGGVLSSDPVVAQNADGRLEVFVRGADNALHHIYQTAPSNGWSSWEFLGGYLTSNPAIGRNADGRLEVFVRGGNNALYSKWQLRPGSREWSDWTYFGGVLTSDPAVAQTADGRLAVFVRGGNQALYQIYQMAPNNGWSSWEFLGGYLTSNPAVGRNAAGMLELFVRGGDNALHRRLQRPEGG